MRQVEHIDGFHLGDFVRFTHEDTVCGAEIESFDWRESYDEQRRGGRPSWHVRFTVDGRALWVRTENLTRLDPLDGLDRGALRQECAIYVQAALVAEGAHQLGLDPRVRQRALAVQDTAIARGLRPEHVQAYLTGQL